MPIEYQKKVARLKDTVAVEEAEGLLEWLQKHPRNRIDLSACTHLHAANLQVLMAVRPAVAAWPATPDLRAWLEPILKSK